MRFLRTSDLSESRLREEAFEEHLFTKDALRLETDFGITRETLGGVTFSTLYNWSRRYEYIYFADVLKKISQDKRPTILDVGCGTSYAPWSFSKRSDRYVGIDLIDLGRFYQHLTDRVCFLQHDITASPVSDEEFDVAISISVLEHIPREKRMAAFANIGSSVKPEGSLVVSFDIDLEGGRSGFTLDEVTEVILLLESIGFQSSEEIDLAVYPDLVTTEEKIGLPANRHQLSWRRPAYTRSTRAQALRRLATLEPAWASLAVIRGHFTRSM